MAQFYNQPLDKKGLKRILSWFLENYGPTRTAELVEYFKTLGYHAATKSGLSLGFEDLRVPKTKNPLLEAAQKQVQKCEKSYLRGAITALERYQKFIDIWTTTSETLKEEVVQNFQRSPLNPLYMMAFSGARGNISQVRQLVGMRGLMSDSGGGIIDFPIRSNFRDGLSVTEYVISCYGARKGLIDTALRTADSGYLTRRLVDVAHGIIIGQIDCFTKASITVSLSEKALLGRVLAENLFDTRAAASLPTPNFVSYVDRTSGLMSPRSQSRLPRNNPQLRVFRRPQGTPIPDKRKAGTGLVLKNQDISWSLSAELLSRFGTSENPLSLGIVRSEIRVRSPLTCDGVNFARRNEEEAAKDVRPRQEPQIGNQWSSRYSEGICQLCYGWNLSLGRLVSIGDAVGVLAAQSIGEPGTQLTMRTFHTGGIFSTDVQDKIFAPHDGFISFLRSSVKSAAVNSTPSATNLLDSFADQKKLPGGGRPPRSWESTEVAKTTTESLLFAASRPEGRHKPRTPRGIGFSNASQGGEEVSSSVSENPSVLENNPFISLAKQVRGCKVRSVHGETGFLTFEPLQLQLRSSPRRKGEGRISLANQVSILQIPAQTLLFVYPGKFMKKNTLCAEISRVRVQSLPVVSSSVPTGAASRLMPPILLGKQVSGDSPQRERDSSNARVIRGEKVSNGMNSRSEILEDNVFASQMFIAAQKKPLGPLASLESFALRKPSVEPPRPSVEIFASRMPSGPKSAGLKLVVKDATNISKKTKSIEKYEIQAAKPRNLPAGQSKVSRVELLPPPPPPPELREKENAPQSETARKFKKVLSEIQGQVVLASRFRDVDIDSTASQEVWVLAGKAYNLPPFEFGSFHRADSPLEDQILGSKTSSPPTLRKPQKGTAFPSNNKHVFRVGDLIQWKGIRQPFGSACFAPQNPRLRRPAKLESVLNRRPGLDDVPYEFREGVVLSSSEQKILSFSGGSPFSSLAVESPLGTLASVETPRPSGEIFASRMPSGPLVLPESLLFAASRPEGRHKPRTPRGLIGKPAAKRFRSENSRGFCATKQTLAKSVGDFIRNGSEIEYSGQIIRKRSSLISNSVLPTSLYVLRRVQPHLFSGGAKRSGRFYENKPPHFVGNGAVVQEREIIFQLSLPVEQSKTGDIVQGLPKIEQLFEGRGGSMSDDSEQTDNSSFSERAGTDDFMLRSQNVPVLQQRYLMYADLLKKSNVRTKNQSFGGFYTQKSLNPETLLRHPATKRFILQRRLVDEIQSVYQSQGVEIADKHVEIIVRQMTSKVRILEKGNSPFFPDDIVDFQNLRDLNPEHIDYEPIILGITKMSFLSQSWLSSASFQETKRVLIQSALQSRVDFFTGLKENVIVGRFIPAGTGSGGFLPGEAGK